MEQMDLTSTRYAILHKYNENALMEFMGMAAKIAAESYQEAKGITADGEVGPNTLRSSLHKYR